MARTIDPHRTAQRRDAITHVAATLFAAHGFERTTAAQIARAAGLSSGSIFYYFADKAAVFRSIFEQSIPEHTALVSLHIDRTDCLDAVLDLTETLAGESLDPVAPGLMVELLRRIDQDPELAQVVAADTRISVDAVTTLLTRGIELGQIDESLPPEETARWILSIVDAAFLNADPDDPHDPRPLLRTTVSRLLQPNRTEHLA